MFSTARDSLARVTRSVVKVVPNFETAPTAIPFVGTAFVVAPRLAITASFVADALVGRGGNAEVGPLGFLEFGNDGEANARRVAISKRHRVHPYWRFTFLSFEEPVAADSILTLAGIETRDKLDGRSICVVGYPAMETRPGKI